MARPRLEGLGPSVLGIGRREGMVSGVGVRLLTYNLAQGATTTRKPTFSWTLPELYGQVYMQRAWI